MMGKGRGTLAFAMWVTALPIAWTSGCGDASEEPELSQLGDDGDSCRATRDCGPGLRCRNQVCRSDVQLGGPGDSCRTGDDCDETLKCRDEVCQHENGECSASRECPVGATCADGLCCGDDICAFGEDCEADCGSVCGDGKCGDSETCSACAEDCDTCPDTCGDNTCDATENCLACPDDCGACPECGDDKCEGRETCNDCEVDCGPCDETCGDAKCSSTESCASCPVDCGPCPDHFCGDGSCIDESCESCPTDCGSCDLVECGDGTCSSGEAWCPYDCPPVILPVPAIPQATQVWCWAAATEMILAYHSRGAYQCEIVSYWTQLPCCPEGNGLAYCYVAAPSLDAVAKAVDVGGVDGNLVPRPLQFEELVGEIDGGHPMIVGYSGSFSGHVVVLHGYDWDGNVYIIDPYFGTFVVPFATSFTYSGSLIWSGTILTRPI